MFPQPGEFGNFHRYTAPRPLEKIQADIQQVEKEIVAMLRDVAR